MALPLTFLVMCDPNFRLWTSRQGKSYMTNHSGVNFEQKSSYLVIPTTKAVLSTGTVDWWTVILTLTRLKAADNPINFQARGLNIIGHIEIIGGDSLLIDTIYAGNRNIFPTFGQISVIKEVLIFDEFSPKKL